MATFNLPLSNTVATQEYGNTVAVSTYANTVAVTRATNTIADTTLSNTVQVQEYTYTLDTEVDHISMADQIFTDEDTAIPYNTRTTVLTVNPTSKFRLVSYKVTGTAEAEIEIVREGTIIMKDRTSTADRSAEHYWTVAPPVVESTEQLLVKITHYEVNNQSFFVSVSGYYE